MSNPHHDPQSVSRQGPQATVRDPVCGMDVPATSKYRRTYRGVEYLFCCGHCQAKFAAEPERYAAPPVGATRRGAPTGGEYTGPKHPEIVPDGPGACPLCGMALGPKTGGGGEAGENPHL
jgi:Cu+-exporting ATPase